MSGRSSPGAGGAVAMLAKLADGGLARGGIDGGRAEGTAPGTVTLRLGGIVAAARV